MPGNTGTVTAGYIAFHAAERPDAVAIINNGSSITYAELARQIRKFMHALRTLDLAPGAKAAVDCEDAYFNLLMRLAFEQLRVATAIVGLGEKPGPFTILRDFDIVLSGKSSVIGAARHHRTTTEWLQGVLASGEEDPEPAPQKQADDPVRVVLTSGTTGRSKKLVYSRRIHEAHIARVLWLTGFTRASRYLHALPVAVSGSAACLRAGGTVVFERRMTLAKAIAAHGITHTTMPPFALMRLLDEMPEDFPKPDNLLIWSFGAPISHALREKASARLVTDLWDIYSSNEADSVSVIRASTDIGTIWPGVRVEIVDDHDRPLPFGQVGHIRVRSDCMVTGYLDFPEAAGRIFKDGWFYAGDMGVLHDAHRLRVLGRSDDVLNIGGKKVAPEVIEDRVLKLGQVAGVGVCGAPNRDGIEEACIAVAGQRCSDEELLRRITEALRDLQLGRFHVIRVPAIPRTANGKLQRKALREIAATVQARSSAWS
jgi:acyl-coenzyme A synthetase/AMP-(fatty) acid ligase